LRAIFLGPFDHEPSDRPAESQSRIDVAAKVNTCPESRLAGFVSYGVQINGVVRKQVSEGS
jgi:hypothetical protein